MKYTLLALLALVSCCPVSADEQYYKRNKISYGTTIIEYKNCVIVQDLEGVAISCDWGK